MNSLPNVAARMLIRVSFKAIGSSPSWTNFFYRKIVKTKFKVFDIIEMENDERDELLKMSESEMTDVAKFCNRYPNIEMNHEVEDPDDVKTGQPTMVNVTLEREDELQGNVIGEFYVKNGFTAISWYVDRILMEHKSRFLI